MKYKVLILMMLLVSGMTEAAIVKGRIVDKNDEPLDYVNVAIRYHNNKAKVFGTSSETNGTFLIKEIDQVGVYILEASFIGYKTETRKIEIKSLTDIVNVGTIELDDDSKMLKEVEVVGQASQMRFDIDKKVYNVDANIAAAGASATDILENIPSVDVDQDGEVSLRNNSSVEVWINGKPSGLTEDNRAQILQQLPAGSIESVEIITNPSAKFDPEGTSGIINIILKKDRALGYYGSVNASGSINTNARPGAKAGVNFNLNHKVVDFYINAGFDWNKFQSNNLTDRYSFSPNTQQKDTLSYLHNMQEGVNTGWGVFVRTGLDFHIGKKNTLSISGMIHTGRWSSEAANNYTYVEWPYMDTTLYVNSNDRASKRPTYSATLEHNYEIDRKGSEVRTSVEFSTNSNSGDYNYHQTCQKGNAAVYEQVQRRDGEKYGVKFKSDYTQKIKDNMKLEAGIYGSWDNRYSPSRTWNLENGDSVLQQYNDFTYEEWIAAVYATYGAKFGGFSFSAGLRGEYTKTTVQTKDSVVQPYARYDTSYFKLYPTLFLSYDFGKGNELQANYTRRIRRPRGRQLNPFRDVSDSTNVQFGNPYLSPEISNAVELNYIKSWENHVLSVSAYYRFTDNCIERVRYLDPEGKNVMYTTYDNVAKRQSAGLEIVAKNKFCNWVNMTTTLNGYYSNMADVYYDVYGTGEPVLLYEKTNSFSWSIRIMLNFLIPYGMTAQLTGQYRSANLVAQGETTDQYTLDFGFRKSFLDKKLNLALSIRDILNSRKWATTTYGDTFWQYAEHQPHGTNFKLTVTYNFGNGDKKFKKKGKQQESSGDSSGDEMDMIDGGMD